MNSLTVEDFVRQQLGDTQTNDYFPGSGELTGIIWAFVLDRTRQVSLNLGAIETRSAPLPTPGVSTIGTEFIYDYTQYTFALYDNILSFYIQDSLVNQNSHKYALFQANAYVDDEFAAIQPDINEIILSATFSVVTSGAVQLRGYAVNLSRLMNDIFNKIADDEGKLAIFQKSLSTTTDLREVAAIARKRAAEWLVGTTIYKEPLKGFRR